MAYSISDLKTELAAVFHGTTLNKVIAIDNLINRAARQLLGDVDPMETKRITEITNALYDKVYDYPLPADLKGDRIIDIRPQVNRTMRDQFFQTYNKPFDLSKSWINNAGLFTINFNTAVKSVRIAANLLPGTLINAASSITENGTWAVGGTASNLELDQLNYVAGNGSLSFTIDAGADPSVAYLENSTMTSLDLTQQENQGALFLYVYIPEPLGMDSFTLRWGSSAGNYWTRTVTQAQNSTAFQRGWNLLRFDWENATVVGVPDVAAIDYLRFVVTYDGVVQTNVRLNSITSQLGSIYEIEYYSKYLFRNSTTGAFQETMLDDADLINLDTDSYNMFFNLVAYYVAQQTQGSNAGFDSAFFKQAYDETKVRYVAKIRSETIKPQQTYYSMPPRNADYTWMRNG